MWTVTVPTKFRVTTRHLTIELGTYKKLCGQQSCNISASDCVSSMAIKAANTVGQNHRKSELTQKN